VGSLDDTIRWTEVAAAHMLICDPVPVTEYAYDRTRNALLAVWSVGIGNIAETAVAFGEDLPDAEHALQLGYDLTQLSKELWRTYTHPLSQAVDQPEVALLRARNQLAIDLVTEAMRLFSTKGYEATSVSQIWVCQRDATIPSFSSLASSSANVGTPVPLMPAPRGRSAPACAVRAVT